MANWMETMGVISAIVGLLVDIPAIYLAVKNLYYRIHCVSLCCGVGKGGADIISRQQVSDDPRTTEEGRNSSVSLATNV